MRNLYELLGMYFVDLLREDIGSGFIRGQSYSTLKNWARFKCQIGSISKEECEDVIGNHNFTEGLNNFYKVLDEAKKIER